MGWAAYIGVALTFLKDLVAGSIQHRAKLKELAKQSEIEAAKAKAEGLRRQTEEVIQDKAFIESNLSPSLGDKIVRRVALIAVFSPFVLILVDFFGYPQYGSELVARYFYLIKTTLPEGYIIFVTSMVAGYFGIIKVRDFFKIKG